MVAFFLAGLLLVGRATSPGSDSLLEQAEHLFLNRHLASGWADSALALASRPATGKAGLALRARMYCQLGEEAPDRETQVRLCRRARAAADSLLALDENSAAGQLWRASALGRLVALQGPLRAAAAAADIRRGLERAVELAPRDALARYALGRLMNELPGMLGGSRARAEDELR
ncbi:hypothetical protein JXB37_07745, partial [candidate division WOR-3 bacterium]|nr:hypothetical protein [candidate division WOR-3 bacterium]